MRRMEGVSSPLFFFDALRKRWERWERKNPIPLPILLRLWCAIFLRNSDESNSLKHGNCSFSKSASGEKIFSIVIFLCASMRPKILANQEHRKTSKPSRTSRLTYESALDASPWQRREGGGGNKEAWARKEEDKGQGRSSVRNKARLKSELPASETQSWRRHLHHFNRLSEDHQLD